MPYASAGVRELWFGASSAAPLPGFEGQRPAAGARLVSIGQLCRSPRARARRWRGTFVGLQPPPAASCPCHLLTLP
jgi:hypothetical protein